MTAEQAVAEASATMRFDPPAARFRAKGKLLRFERPGIAPLDFRVVAVSYPDDQGVCTLTLESYRPEWRS